MYLVNEIFYTLQGEGYWSGRPAVFVRFSRCNLWTGREEDRAQAICKFCDTDFLRATYRFTVEALCDAIQVEGGDCRFVVLTGGEPSLQVDDELINALHKHGYYVAIETNGTRCLPEGIDWICVSPKAGTVVMVDEGDELKIVYPQDFDVEWWFDNTNFNHRWLSPMDGPALQLNMRAVIDYVLAHPHWQLNIQTHKVIGVR